MKAPKKLPRPHPLAIALFDVGMMAWRKADPKKSPMKFSDIESHGQVAAWNAIARHVDKMIRSAI